MPFFSYESKFSQMMIKLSYSCWLNLLWLICSIPVFTLGAATTALYDVSLKIVRDEETSITRQFFRSFRRNFRQSTVLWLILLVPVIAALTMPPRVLQALGFLYLVAGFSGPAYAASRILRNIFDRVNGTSVGDMPPATEK